MRDVPDMTGRLRALTDAINQNFLDVFNEIRYLIAREDEPATYAFNDESVTSSTTLQNDDELFLPVKANARYELRMVLVVAQAATGVGITYDWTVPTGTILRAQVSHAANIVSTVTESGSSI